MDIQHMIAVIQVYIHLRTDKEVQIRIDGPGCIPKIQHAYFIAEQYLQQVGANIIPLN